MSRPSKEEFFACPICGTEVSVKAKACPECGSDERTGWSDKTIYDATGIEDPEDDFDYDDFVEKEFGKPKLASRGRWGGWFAIIVIVVLILWLVAERVGWW